MLRSHSSFDMYCMKTKSCDMGKFLSTQAHIQYTQNACLTGVSRPRVVFPLLGNYFQI